MQQNKLKPILFSTSMVQAILEGRKTMTRRIVKPKELYSDFDYLQEVISRLDSPSSPKKPLDDVDDYSKRYFKCGTGDTLWVRETWQHSINPNEFVYKADCNNPFYENTKWKPSIFMPKSAARIFLEITDIKVERLQDISEEDAIHEGIEPVESFNSGEGVSSRQMFKNYLPVGYTEVLPKNSFQSLWQSINGAESWDENPFVWVISFKRVSSGLLNDTWVCESCGKHFAGDIVSNDDDDDNHFCEDCYKELAPVMKADYEELKVKVNDTNRNSKENLQRTS